MDQKSKKQKSGQNEDKETLKEYLNQYTPDALSGHSLKDGLKISGRKWMPL